MSLLVGIGHLLLSCLLLIGIGDNNLTLILFWLVAEVINLVVCCSLLVVIFVMAVDDDEMINELAAAGFTITYMIIMGCLFYLWVVVRSYYMQLKDALTVTPIEILRPQLNCSS